MIQGTHFACDILLLFVSAPLGKVKNQSNYNNDCQRWSNGRHKHLPVRPIAAKRATHFAALLLIQNKPMAIWLFCEGVIRDLVL